jgi:hypothetical protein
VAVDDAEPPETGTKSRADPPPLVSLVLPEESVCTFCTAGNSPRREAMGLAVLVFVAASSLDKIDVKLPLFECDADCPCRSKPSNTF